MHFLRINKTLLMAIAALALAVALALSMTLRPRVAIAAALPDFREFTAGDERKNEFFSFMRPIVEQQNEQILADRERLLAIEERGSVGWRDLRWVRKIAARYDVALATESETDADAQRPVDEVIDDLLLRVDAVPESLALAQAAKESGWGTSRFAREGNNLFGEWCFTDGCGIVPRQRGAGKSHEVQAFPTPAESVASYLDNINTHDSYKAFRRARKEQRESAGKLSGVDLAAQLSHYSERREAYVQELRNLIIYNDLEDEDAGQPES